MKLNKILVLILIIATALQTFGLDSKVPWYDEAYALSLSGESITWVLFDMALIESHPPLYHIVIHFLLSVTDSVFILRFTSVLFGVLSVLITYLIAEKTFGQKTAMLSALLLSISPLFVFNAHWLRPYTFLTFFSLLTLYLTFRMIDNNDKKSWIFWIASTIVNIYIHYYAFFILFAEIVFLLYLRFVYGKKLLKRMLTGIFAIAISYTPWLYMILTKTIFSETALYLERPSIASLIYTFFKFSIGLRRTTLIDWRIMALIIIPPISFAFIYGIYTLYLKSGESHGLTGRPKNPESDNITEITTPQKYYLLVMYHFLPLIVSFTVSQFVPMFGFRYFLIILPVFLMFTARGIMEIRDKRLALLMALAIALIHSYIIYDFYFLIPNVSWYQFVGL